MNPLPHFVQIWRVSLEKAPDGEHLMIMSDSFVMNRFEGTTNVLNIFFHSFIFDSAACKVWVSISVKSSEITFYSICNF